MDIPTSALSKLGGYLAELLSPEGASYKTFGVVLLAAAAAGEGLVVYEDPIRKILVRIDENEEAREVRSSTPYFLFLAAHHYQAHGREIKHIPCPG